MFYISASFLSKYTSLCIIGSYIYACMWASLPLLGWGQYGVEPYGTSCTLKWTANKGFVTVMLIACIIFPVVVMKCCYGGVYLYLRRHCRTFRTMRNKMGDNVRKREEYLIKVSLIWCAFQSFCNRNKCSRIISWRAYIILFPTFIVVPFTFQSVLDIVFMYS